MGIKWENINLGVSPLTNQIMMGKSTPLKDNPRLSMWTDKSGDITNEVIGVVMQHMLYNLKENGNDSYEEPGKYRLTISLLEETDET